MEMNRPHALNQNAGVQTSLAMEERDLLIASGTTGACAGSPREGLRFNAEPERGPVSRPVASSLHKTHHPSETERCPS